MSFGRSSALDSDCPAHLFHVCRLGLTGNIAQTIGDSTFEIVGQRIIVGCLNLFDEARYNISPSTSLLLVLGNQLLMTLIIAQLL